MRVILDFDGTLADTGAAILAAAEVSAALLGVVCQPLPADLDALERMSFDMLGRRLGLAEPRLPAFVQGCLEWIANQPPPPLAPGMGTVVRDLAGEHALGLLTGNARRVVDRFLTQHQLAPFFQQVVTLEDPGTRVEKLERVAAALGDGTGTVVMVGDAVSDIRAARAVGALSVAVAWGHQSVERLRRAGADHIVGRPEDLLELLG